MVSQTSHNMFCSSSELFSSLISLREVGRDNLGCLPCYFLNCGTSSSTLHKTFHHVMVPKTRLDALPQEEWGE